MERDRINTNLNNSEASNSWVNSETGNNVAYPDLNQTLEIAKSELCDYIMTINLESKYNVASDFQSQQRSLIIAEAADRSRNSLSQKLIDIDPDNPMRGGFTINHYYEVNHNSKINSDANSLIKNDSNGKELIQIYGILLGYSTLEEFDRGRKPDEDSLCFTVMDNQLDDIKLIPISAQIDSVRILGTDSTEGVWTVDNKSAE